MKPSWEGLVQVVSFEGEDIKEVFARAGDYLAERSEAPALEDETRLELLSNMPQMYLERIDQHPNKYQLILFLDVEK